MKQLVQVMSSFHVVLDHADVSILSISLAIQHQFITCLEGKAMAFQVCCSVCVENFYCTILTLVCLTDFEKHLEKQ